MVSSALAWDGATDERAWAALSEELELSRAKLALVMQKAAEKGLTTDYAYVSKVTMDQFKTFSAWDYAHPEVVQDAYKKAFWSNARKNPDAYLGVAFDELSGCLDVANHAIAELEAQLSGQIRLQSPPDFSQGVMQLEGDTYRLDGQVVFPSKIVWMPDDEPLMKAFGYLGGSYTSLSQFGPDEKHTPRYLKSRIEDMANEVQGNRVPQSILYGHRPAKWMLEDYPELDQGERWFICYDIFHPKISKWLKTLFREFVSQAAATAGDAPKIHIIANEPHLAFREGGIIMGPDVKKLDFSTYTWQVFAQWLEKKYATVEQMNVVYGSDYQSFDQVTYQVPVNADCMIGSAAWYDLCRFNMDRLNGWFTFLKQQVHQHDPNKSPTTIKLLGRHLEEAYRDDGIDLEYLTKLQDMLGADNQVVPLKLERCRREYMDWQKHYMLEWREQSITLDFAKSLCPEKPFYDSEWHGISGGGWAAYQLDREYVRTALWMAFSHGVSVINTWVWGRKPDGAMLEKALPLRELLTMPTALDSHGRTMKELNAHAESIRALVPKTRNYIVYYCEESAIQDAHYPQRMAETYEALKLLNLPVGFTTPSEIVNLDVGTQTVFVSPTEYISDRSLAELKAFEQRGGRIVLINGEAERFSKNELGQVRNKPTSFAPLAELEFEPVFDLVQTLESELKQVKPAQAIDVQIRDAQGVKSYGVLASQTKQDAEGNRLLLLINLSQQARQIALNVANALAATFTNLITGVAAPNNFRIEPYGILLVQQR